MKTLVHDWVDFCTDTKSFDKSYFSGLFLLDLSDDELRAIFQYFNSAESLITRLKNVKASGNQTGRPFLQPDKTIPKEQLIEFVRLDLQEKASLCQELDDEELAQLIRQARVEFTEDSKAVIDNSGQDNPSEWVFELIGDYIDEARGTDLKIQALEEACYGLATNYYLAWYIMAPLFQTSIDFENYFNVWRHKGIFVIQEGRVLVSSN
ncbi:MAG: hypothetical protein ACR2PX_24675 [Endozoicomonas sp.]|uniref:hypothetical protein n=1 Tax=Endozoicomonas sp. TaxID=1892382 RepID=UPI003D9AC1F0